MQFSNPMASIDSPAILESLPSPSVADGFCPRRARMQIDLLLLAIEALDANGSETILAVVDELGLERVISDRVTLWRMRSSNPLRNLNQRRSLSIVEGKSLVVILCYLSRRLTGVLRQLVLTQQQLADKEQAATDDFYLAAYVDRFRSHFKSRMSQRRSADLGYDSPESLNALALDLLAQLLFCTGTSGMQRLWISLFDGEV
jgi:Protein of unknown function (DUF3038)